MSSPNKDYKVPTYLNCWLKSVRFRFRYKSPPLELLRSKDPLVLIAYVLTYQIGVHPLREAVEKAIMPGLVKATHIGIHWCYARPPVQNIEFEMDLRGVRLELVLELP